MPSVVNATGAKLGKTCNRCQIRVNAQLILNVGKWRNWYQVWENAKLVLCAGKRATGIKRGKRGRGEAGGAKSGEKSIYEIAGLGP